MVQLQRFAGNDLRLRDGSFNVEAEAIAQDVFQLGELGTGHSGIAGTWANGLYG